MNVEWVKCQNDVWCDLANVNLDASHFNALEGVYIIWHRGAHPATVRVGQGIIKDRLATHRNDRDIQAFAHLGLSVTWASVAAPYRNGVEAFLATRLTPEVGERFPNSRPIEVTLPW